MYGAPVDLSFKNIINLAACLFVLSPSPQPQPVASAWFCCWFLPVKRELLLPTVTKFFLTGVILIDTWLEEPNRGLRPLKRNSEMKYLSCSLRLSNNNITELHDLQKTISHFLAESTRLTWLDLSFNKITHIDHVLCELHELRVLYLHGNSIFILSEVDRLGVLPHLHSITLHGNVIETNKVYRNRVISVLPRLKMMDFSAVTRQERDLAKIWHQSNSRCRSSKVNLQ